MGSTGLAGRIDRVERRMDSMEQRPDASFATLSTQILQSRREMREAIVATRTDLSRDITALCRDVSVMIVDSETRLDAKFDGKLAGLETRFDGKLADLETRLDTRFDGKLAGLETRFDGKLAGLEVKIEAIAKETREAIVATRTDLSRDITALCRDVSVMIVDSETRLDAKFDGKLAGLEVKIEASAKETRSFMLMLNEDVLNRIAVLGGGRPSA